MRIINIGTDRNLFVKDSVVLKRHIEYARLVDEIHIVVFTKKKDEFNKKQIAKNAWLYPTNSRIKLLYIFDAVKIVWKIINNKQGWLITTQDPFETGLVGLVACMAKKIPLHFQFHTDVFNDRWIKENMLNRIRYIIMLFIIPFADGFRVVSKHVIQNLIKRGVSEEMITYTPVYSDVKLFQDEQKDHGRKNKEILYTGRFVKEKNLPFLFRAFAIVSKKDVEAKLVLVGDGPLRSSLAALSKKLGINESVKFVPWTDNLVSYYKTASVFVLPSYYEGWGRVVVESLAAGTPVIMTDVGCAGEVVRDGVEGFIVQHDNEQQLAEKIILMLEDEKLRDDMSKRGKERVSQLLSQEETLQLYKKSWELAYEKTVKREKV